MPSNQRDKLLHSSPFKLRDEDPPRWKVAHVRFWSRRETTAWPMKQSSTWPPGEPSTGSGREASKRTRRQAAAWCRRKTSARFRGQAPAFFGRQTATGGTRGAASRCVRKSAVGTSRIPAAGTVTAISVPHTDLQNEKAVTQGGRLPTNDACTAPMGTTYSFLSVSVKKPEKLNNAVGNRNFYYRIALTLFAPGFTI